MNYFTVYSPYRKNHETLQITKLELGSKSALKPKMDTTMKLKYIRNSIAK
jgi:hypothetical protein